MDSLEDPDLSHERSTATIVTRDAYEAGSHSHMPQYGLLAALISSQQVNDLHFYSYISYSNQLQIFKPKLSRGQEGVPKHRKLFENIKRFVLKIVTTIILLEFSLYGCCLRSSRKWKIAHCWSDVRINAHPRQAAWQVGKASNGSCTTFWRRRRSCTTL